MVFLLCSTLQMTEVCSEIMAFSAAEYRIGPLIPVLIVTALGLIALEVSLGTVHIPLQEVIHFLFGSSVSDPIYSTILSESRIPRTFGAMGVGIGLSLSGWLMQTLFRNPLASPSILGISSGSSLAVALFVLAGSALGIELTSIFSVSLAAMAGAMSILLLIMAVSFRMKDSITLLLFGIMIGHLFGGIESILLQSAAGDQVRSFVIWGMGSFSSIEKTELVWLGSSVILALSAIFILLPRLNVLLLGEDYAKSMGLNIFRTRTYIIVITGIITGTCTALAGPIAFIGLIVPHLARFFYKTSDHKKLFLPIILLGMNIALLSDLIARITSAPLNAITSAMGAPIVIWLLLKNNRTTTFFS